MKKIYFSSLAIILCGVANAQYAGLNSSNWAGITTISQNPAIADSRFVCDVSLGAASIAANNNMLGVSSSSLLFAPVLAQATNVDFFKNNIFDSDSNATRRNARMFNATTRTQVQGPLSFMFGFGNRNENAVAFSYNINVIKSIRGVNADLYNFANDFLSPAHKLTVNQNFQNINFGITSLAWADIGITYSRVLFDNNTNLIKAGVTLKYIQGLSAEILNTSNANISFYEKYQTADFNNVNFNYARTENVFTMAKPVFDFSQAKPTVGADIGFVYEWRPKIATYRYEMDGLKNIRPRDMDLHKIAAGVSVSDIGVVDYKSTASAHNFNLNGYYTNNADLANNYNFRSRGYQQFESFINDTSFAKTRARSTNFFKIPLPMRLTAFFDLNINKGFGINLNARIYPAISKSPMFAHDVTTITATARYDHSWFGIYIPFSYDLNNNFNVGLGARLGPVSIGFQNLLAFMPKGVFNGELYAAVHIPIPNKRKKDSDHDLVSDKYDLCPHDAGTWATKGCPDMDSDGIYDAIDSCPNDPGLAKYHGCPDRDGDGIIDKNDSCPDEPGTVELFGCPDKDHDGVADKWDECPDKFGPATANGCPDRDGDGVPDYRDDCPNDKGPKELKGCPDTDGDGVPDKDDICPKLRGPVEHHGCPDSDDDGVFDDEDKCPNVVGTVANHGCPDEDDDLDSDGDGVPDRIDKCPYQKGPKMYQGCPTPTHLKVENEDAHYGEVTFDESQSSLLYVGKALLDQFIKFKVEDLKNTSGYQWIIMLKAYADKEEGETAKEKENLSKRRLVAVRDYLVNHGIPEELIVGDYIGDTEFIAASDTEAHRKQNRVVEIIQRLK